LIPHHLQGFAAQMTVSLMVLDITSFDWDSFDASLETAKTFKTHLRQKLKKNKAEKIKLRKNQSTKKVH
jgi:hypothetical protein